MEESIPVAFQNYEDLEKAVVPVSVLNYIICSTVGFI